MNETTITASRKINCPSSRVWEVLSDYGNIANFHPLVKRSYATNTIRGLGATRHCDLLPMGAMEEKITNWEDGRSFVSEVMGGKMLPPCHFMRGIVQLQPSEEGCEVHFTFSYALKFGLLGKFMNLFLKPQFEKGPPKYLYGLDQFVSSNHSTK
ncbi:SRPBCC family protein [Ekhidna sp.]|uniref:SRPBCC family protein n=1 Tax=Ekhidna sp. TaxID=2608089 RepID=UPI003CCC0148